MSAGIQQVATNTNLVAEKSAQAAETAKIGGTSVTKAVNQMAYIEQTVNYSAQVVTTLGERLKEIGQIVDTNQVKKICAAIQQMASDSQQIVSSVKEIGGLSKNASSEAQRYRQLQRNNRHLWMKSSLLAKVLLRRPRTSMKRSVSFGFSNLYERLGGISCT